MLQFVGVTYNFESVYLLQRKLSRSGLCLFHNSSQVAHVRAAASAHDSEMREFLEKSTDQLAKFFGIAFVKLFRLVQFRMTASGSIGNNTPENWASPLLLQFPFG